MFPALGNLPSLLSDDLSGSCSYVLTRWWIAALCEIPLVRRASALLRSRGLQSKRASGLALKLYFNSDCPPAGKDFPAAAGAKK